MADFVPHTPEEIEAMLAFLGLSDTSELFEVVPEAVRLAQGLDLPVGLAQADVGERLDRLARLNSSSELVCFAGAGAYDHDIPAVTRSLAGRSEFVTAYTPYQPEVAQGVLQALFEFQTMISRLSGLAVSNASLYDGASSCVEALNLATAATGRSAVWMSDGVHPHWRAVVTTFARGTGHDIASIPLVGGTTRWPDPATYDRSGVGAMTASADGPPAAIVVAYPNFLGCLEDLDTVRRVASETGAMMVVAFDPVAAGVLRSVGGAGADVVVGEGQALGTALNFGGPYLGLFACTMAQVRRLPGRLVGETVDGQGRRSYVTTLRAREQDIRREKASSNVCTNQTLMAVTAAIQLGWLGTSGLRELGLRCARGARYCRELLLAIEGVEPLTDAATFREFAIRTPLDPRTVVDRLAEDGFLAGVALEDDMGVKGAEGSLLVAVTETRTRTQIDSFASAFEKAVKQ
ncbi:MAG: aminomethyl-transferring glycine dehydrogenase subunit GcvPA [Acidimicrobiales bacterium]